MMVLKIIAAVFGVLILLVVAAMFLPLKLEVKLKKTAGDDPSPRLTAAIGFVRFKILPKKQKKIRLSKFSKKNFEKMTKKTSAGDTKSTQSGKKSETSGNNIKDVLPGTIGETVDLVLELVDRFTGYLKCSVNSLSIGVSAADAAQTALLYAGVGTAMEAFMEILHQNTVMKVGSPGNIGVYADFVSGEFTADIDISLSILIINVLRSGSGIVAVYLRRLIGADKNKNANKNASSAERRKS